MSTHEVLVVQIEEVTKHPNADTLSVIKMSGNDYTAISRTGDFQVGDLAIYIEPDYKINTLRPEFAFLHDGKRDTLRISAKRLRGVWSEGLLVKTQAHHKLGDNVLEEYGIERYEPPIARGFKGGFDGGKLNSGLMGKPPPIPAQEYGLENFKKHSKLIDDGEEVYYTVKIHGSNFRAVFWEDQMYCGSRTTWKYKPGTVIERTHPYTQEKIEIIAGESTWWEALEQNPWIEEWCRNHPGMVVYGEVFGENVQGAKFHYGYKGNALGVRVFDVLVKGLWTPFQSLVEDPVYQGLKLVPIVFNGPHNKDKLQELAELDETAFDNCGDKHIREGIVIKLKTEKLNERIGRVALKYVSNNYLSRS